MNKISYEKYDRFPADLQMFSFLQAKIDCLQQLGFLGSKGNYIVSGDNVTGGWVFVSGELLPLIAGSGATVYIAETYEPDVQAEGQVFSQVYAKREVRFGSGVNSHLWSSFEKLDDLLTLKNELKTIAETSNSHFEDKQNPHEVTKKQVGLEHLPNAKSDRTDLNDSNTLATSKAVFDIVNSTTKVLLKGEVDVNEIKGSVFVHKIEITHNLGKTNYIANCSFFGSDDWTNVYYKVGIEYIQCEADKLIVALCCASSSAGNGARFVGSLKYILFEL